MCVSAPLLAPRFWIDRFVRRHLDWVRRHQERFAALNRQYPEHVYQTGEIFPLWGRDCRLTVIQDDLLKKSVCGLEAEAIVVRLAGKDASHPAAAVRAALQDWYSREVEGRIFPWLDLYAARLGVTFGKVKVVNQRRRWGSCSRQGDLRLSWRLAMLPESALEYVLIHELSHIKRHDHSKHFWEIVASVLPDYRARRTMLRSAAAQTLI